MRRVAVRSAVTQTPLRYVDNVIGSRACVVLLDAQIHLPAFMILITILVVVALSHASNDHCHCQTRRDGWNPACIVVACLTNAKIESKFDESRLSHLYRDRLREYQRVVPES